MAQTVHSLPADRSTWCNCQRPTVHQYGHAREQEQTALILALELCFVGPRSEDKVFTQLCKSPVPHMVGLASLEVISLFQMLS